MVEPMNPYLATHNAHHDRFHFTDIPTTICRHCEAILTGKTTVPPSPIPHLIGSNAIPTPEQSQWIQGAINVAMVDVRRLEEEIWRVKNVLAQLQGECRALEGFVDTHRAFLTPARRVYPEIWAEIFKYCPRGSKHRRFTEVEDSFDPREGPMVLTQVCSAWRQIAMSTPQLWTTIRLTYRGHNASQQALVRAWVQRSGGLPLTIAVMEAKPTGYPKTYPPLNWSESEVLYELCMSCVRWKDLYLLLPASPLPWTGLESIRHELHSLQNLVVHTSRGSLSPDSTVNLFEDAPLLQSITMDHSISFSTIDVPLTQITRLEFSLHKHTPASIDACLLSLDLVPNVQECVFHMGACEPWTTLPMIHHSQLRSLTVIVEPLRDNTQKGLARFFSNISVPNLKSLVVHSVANGRQWDHYSIGHFLSRTPSLETLELKCDNIKANELLEELREAAALTTLTLSVPTRPTEELLDYLSSTDAVNLLPFLVQLQSLSFEGLAKPDFVYRIGRMIACRTMLAKMNRTASLTFVKYDFSSSPAPKFDCSGHAVDSRESQFTITRQSASFVFRRRSAQFTQPLPFSI
ncbi:hypothetical protein D9756_005630 [Leucocoprinus leucothites]|uniref:F-box domain-containing protein n=1 Tax=Leucocoprinus leucothites TaxID=201217 RepID=A0A8H5D8W0_9AGAR|nr:hypothetical protein D9756_005630 [Leucoagaricus leucothites]